MVANIDEGVLEVARDAIREGKPDLVPGIMADQPKLKLISELAAALSSVMRACGVRYATVNSYEHSPPSIMLHGPTAADVHAASEEVGAEVRTVEIDSAEWIEMKAEIGGVWISMSGPHHQFTPAEKRARTLARKRKQREAIDADASNDELRALGLTVIEREER